MYNKNENSNNCCKKMSLLFKGEFIVKILNDYNKGSNQDLISYEQENRHRGFLEAFQFVTEYISDAVCLFDENGIMVVCNHHFSRFIHDANVSKPTIANLFHQFNLCLALSGDIQESYEIITTKDKEPFQFHSKHIPIMEENRLQGIITIVHQTFLDGVTRVPNRQFGETEIKKWIESCQMESQTFAILYFNIDGFNRINSTFGYIVGDKVLKEVAQKVAILTREHGVLFRVDGDEFSVLIKQQEKITDYETLAQKVIDITKIPLYIEGYEIYFTLSVGISIFPRDGQTSVEIIKSARIALNRARELGKNKYITYSPSINMESFKTFQLESELRKAIVNRELYLDYQPRFNAITQEVCGAEALIRWKHPILGIISPGEFIPIAENSEVIQHISDYVIETVCKQIKEWKKNGVPCTPISINVSAVNFLKDNLADQIHTHLHTFGLSTSSIEIEITERALLQSFKIVEAQFARLINTGIKISLDDYGTGYSSIHYLREFPIDTIKIDRSFVQNIVQNRDDKVIVKSIIELAKGLHKTVIIEGVETKEQYEVVKKFGCCEIQGFLFSKPLSGEEIAKIFAGKKSEVHVPMSGIEKREYWRIKFASPIKAKLSGKHIDATDILVEDIGFGGLRCTSHTKLSPHKEYLYEFSLTLMDSSLILTGKIAWIHEINDGLTEYGIQFIIDETKQDQLSDILNKLYVCHRSWTN